MKLIDLVCAYYGRLTIVDRKGEEVYKNVISNRDFYELTRDFAKEADVEIFTLVIDKGFAELKVWLVQSEEEVKKKMIQTRKEEEKKWKKNQKKLN